MLSSNGFRDAKIALSIEETMQQAKEAHRVVLSSLQTRAIIQLLKDTGGGPHPDEVAECADKVMSIPFEPSDSLTLLEALAAYDTE